MTALCPTATAGLIKKRSIARPSLFTGFKNFNGLLGPFTIAENDRLRYGAQVEYPYFSFREYR